MQRSVLRWSCTTSLVALASLAMAGCANPSITAMHNPMYRATPHQSTISATATDTKRGINSVSITATVGTITACNGILPSLIPCRTGATIQARACIFSAQKTPATCTLPLNVQDRQLVTYTASARNSQGRTATTPAITYAGGAPLTQASIRLPFGGRFATIPWETARPVWWHTDAPAGAGDPGRIDVGFFPDADWGTNYQGFTDGLQTVVRGTFFDGSDAFSSFYRFYKHNFNFWAGPMGGNGEDGCVRTLGGAAASVAGAVEGKTILHQLAFRDCADIALGGLGTVESTAGDAAWLFVHESGHFLHGLGDEYGGGGNGSISDPRNTWSSQTACQTAATQLSLPSSQCAQIGTTSFWRIDDGRDTTMEDRVLTSDWRTASGLAVSRRMSKCANGACY